MLLLRGLRERRYETFNRLRIFQVLTVAILGGLLWWHTPMSHIEDRVRMVPYLLIIVHIEIIMAANGTLYKITIKL